MGVKDKLKSDEVSYSLQNAVQKTPTLKKGIVLLRKVKLDYAN